jgi:hypothetical protein
MLYTPAGIAPQSRAADVAVAESQAAATRPARLTVTRCRLLSSTGRPIEQASGIDWGRLGDRVGLWLVCDRNGGASTNQIHFIDAASARAGRDGGAVREARSYPIVPPRAGWSAFVRDHARVPPDALERLKHQLEPPEAGGAARLDLEAITIAPAVTAPRNARERHIFAIAEQPNSLVLELRLHDREAAPCAELVACYHYVEAPGEAGTDVNDGLEGITWAGEPGLFYLVEEGTKPHSDTFKLLFFDAPRLMRARLERGRVIVDRGWSDPATRAVRGQKGGSMQTLNALARLDDRTLAAVDRNGGWILAIDIRERSARRWLNLYDPESLNLRRRLDRFPQARRMPYVSIEGLACDEAGTLWMVDDPAMPEGFRQSCLIRVDAAPAWPTPGG